MNGKVEIKGLKGGKRLLAIRSFTILCFSFVI